MAHRQGFIVLVHIHFIQRHIFNLTNLTSHASD